MSDKENRRKSQSPEAHAEPDSQHNDARRPVLELAGLSAWYGMRQVLDDVSLSLHPGDFICLSGPNGCGKSTLMTLLAGLGRHSLKSAGSIALSGRSAGQLKSKERARLVSFMSQSETSLWNFTVEDLILGGRYCHTGLTGIYSKEDRAIAQEAAELLQLESLLRRPCHSLSGGEFQRVRIARAFCQQPQVLLLDEPAANLDLPLRHDLLHLTKELAQDRGTAVLMSIHDINLAAVFAQKLALLRPLKPAAATSTAEHRPSPATGSRSQLIIGSPAEVMTKKTLRHVYGRSFQIFPHPVHGCPAVWVE